MKSIIPTLHGTIDRRILVNFHIQPAAARRLLPALFRPKLVRGWAVGGICLIRLKEMRPRGFSARCGLASENAAHRFAVEWDDEGVTKGAVVRSVHSSFFMDREVFPEGTVHFDCALLMQNIAHEWRVLPGMKGHL